jgi:hypothetical protein
MIASDLPSPAEASIRNRRPGKGFAQAGNRCPPRIKCGAGFFGIMLSLNQPSRLRVEAHARARRP